MLSQITISNYTIVNELEMDFSAGMTVITGETGAGKSIMLDALGLCLGDRADPRAVRPGCERAEIIVCFDLADLPRASAWLTARELDAGDEVLLRRVITAEGRSRAYINGTPSTLQDCAELGALLVDIHSQHAHQSLLRRSVQRQLLDDYAGDLALVAKVEQCASDWLRQQRELALLTGASDEHGARLQLLSYQLEELDTLNLAAEELASLENEQNMLANAEAILQDAHRALELCDDQQSGVQQALKLLDADVHSGDAAAGARELLDSAAIQLGEARDEIQRHIDRVEINPERLREVQGRLEAIYDIARKHRVMPEQLPQLHGDLAEELRALESGGERIAAIEQEMQALAATYREDAGKLSKKRRRGARKLEARAGDILASLAMKHCELEIALTATDNADPHPHGLEEVEFLISTNPGAPKQALGKIASGGELSRISLAIQVVTASAATVPSMVFDEVDVGIGGAVAEVVGTLLRELSARAQVLCVTHLPQVAAQGEHHLQVTKAGDEKSVATSLRKLSDEDKVQEVARMLGGVKITEQTLAHAREMLTG